MSGNEAEFICCQCEGDYSPFSPLDVESFCANFDSTRDEIFKTEYDRLDTLVFCPFGQRRQEVDATNTSDLNSLDVNVSDPITTITNYYSTPDFNGVVNNYQIENIMLSFLQLNVGSVKDKTLALLAHDFSVIGLKFNRNID